MSKSENKWKIGRLCEESEIPGMWQVQPLFWHRLMPVGSLVNGLRLAAARDFNS